MYPTKKEILKKKQISEKNQEAINILLHWKKNTWLSTRKEGEESRFIALKSMIIQIADMMGRPSVKVEYRPSESSCYYNLKAHTIVVNQSLSIISSLHELGHHLFGKSETIACQWSVLLFKESFPTAFRKLNWHGHVLIK